MAHGGVQMYVCALARENMVLAWKPGEPINNTHISETCFSQRSIQRVVVQGRRCKERGSEEELWYGSVRVIEVIRHVPATRQVPSHLNQSFIPPSVSILRSTEDIVKRDEQDNNFT